MELATERNGSAQDSAKVLISSRLASFVSGKGVGAGRPRKPGRNGQEMMICRKYRGSFWVSNGWFPGESRTDIVSSVSLC